MSVAENAVAFTLAVFQSDGATDFLDKAGPKTSELVVGICSTNIATQLMGVGFIRDAKLGARELLALGSMCSYRAHAPNSAVSAAELTPRAPTNSATAKPTQSLLDASPRHNSGERRGPAVTTMRAPWQVFERGDLASEFYIILKGEVCIFGDV